MNTNAIKSKRDALAAHLGLDLADLGYYRYHYGRTVGAIYAFTSGYYCATKGSQKPVKHKDMEFTWTEVKDAFVNQSDFKIWFMKAESE